MIFLYLASSQVIVTWFFTSMECVCCEYSDYSRCWCLSMLIKKHKHHVCVCVCACGYSFSPLTTATDVHAD